MPKEAPKKVAQHLPKKVPKQAAQCPPKKMPKNKKALWALKETDVVFKGDVEKLIEELLVAKKGEVCPRGVARMT